MSTMAQRGIWLPKAVPDRKKHRQTRLDNLHAAQKIARHTQLEWLVMKHLFKVCVKCRSPHGVEKDHIQPICVGGSDGITNLQPLCGDCNSGKSLDCKDYRSVFMPNWESEFNRRLYIVLE